MVGLNEYIQKHGKHFTVELAYRIVGRKWSAKEIQEYIQKKVYYNISGTTLGDMVYIFNGMWNNLPNAKRYCRDVVIDYVQDIENLDCPAVFEIWSGSGGGNNLDLTEYI